jgi:hypothetical protein
MKCLVGRGVPPDERQVPNFMLDLFTTALLNSAEG